MAKTHISLHVGNVGRSVAFYSRFFGAEPVKLKPGYAKFDVIDPPLNFTVMERPGHQGGSLNHLGIQVESTETVLAAKARLQEAGLLTEDEMNVDCCYALQDKIWVTDPDGHRWEVFHVIVGDTAPEVKAESTCCAPTCCAGSSAA